MNDSEFWIAGTCFVMLLAIGTGLIIFGSNHFNEHCLLKGGHVVAVGNSFLCVFKDGRVAE